MELIIFSTSYRKIFLTCCQQASEYTAAADGLQQVWAMVFVREAYPSAGRTALIEIDETIVVKLAGQGAFERGLAYFDEGRVSAVEEAAVAMSQF